MAFRKGQWVLYNGQIAIHVRRGHVHLVNSTTGETTETLQGIPDEALQTATVEDIPLARRATAAPAVLSLYPNAETSAEAVKGDTVIWGNKDQKPKP